MPIKKTPSSRVQTKPVSKQVSHSRNVTRKPIQVKEIVEDSDFEIEHEDTLSENDTIEQTSDCESSSEFDSDPENNNQSSENCSDEEDDPEEEVSDCESEESEVDEAEVESKKAPKIVDKDDGKDIRGIIFEKINDTFSKGMYAGFIVLIMNKNGYVNVTKMCKDIFVECKKINKDAKEKEFRKWKALDTTKELINTVSSAGQILPAELFITFTSGHIISRGTYVHPDLVPHIASWASPTIAIKISKIVNEYFSNDERKRQRELLKIKDDKIDELLQKQKKQTRLLKSQSVNIDKLLAENKKLMAGMTNLDKKTTNISTKLDKVVPNRVIPTKNTKDAMHFILVRNFRFEKNKCNLGKPKYSILRVQNKSKSNCWNKHKKTYQHATILLELKGNPNVMNLWHRVKQRLTDEFDPKIDVISGTSFNLLEHCTEEELKNDITRVHNERLRTQNIK